MRLAGLGGAGQGRSFGAAHAPGRIEPMCDGGMIGKSVRAKSWHLRRRAGLGPFAFAARSAIHPVFSGWQALEPAPDSQE